MEDKLVQGSMLRSDIRQGFGISFLFAVAGIVSATQSQCLYVTVTDTFDFTEVKNPFS